MSAGGLPIQDEAVAPLFAALSHSPDAAFATDRNNRIVFWNRSAERMLGYAADEILGDSCAGVLEGCDIFGNRYCTPSCPVTQMAARGEAVRHFDLTLSAKDGRTVRVDVSVLHLSIAAPGRFLLLHVLGPAARAEAAPRQDPATDPPPRPALLVVRDSPDARARKLTGREVEVLGMLAAGHPTPEIASRLHISILTARNHVQNILDKLEVHSKAEAVAFAFQKRLM